MNCLSCRLRWQVAILGVLVGIVSSYAGEPDVEGLTKSSAKSVPAGRILDFSRQIDALVLKQLESAGQSLNPRASDEVFLRRAYLDIVGRIPSLQETREFLASDHPDKRAYLIDTLLDSYGYTSRQFNYWADLLRVQSRLSGNLSGLPYIDFIKDSLETNKPYDEFVYELVSANGANLERGNGAVGYYLRDRDMPEDNMSNTIRVFLGTRLECAQCHDHPFDKWTQRQYFEMVAFTGGLSYRDSGASQQLAAMRQKLRGDDVPEKIRPFVNRLTRQLSHGIDGSGTGLARLPENFLGSDGYDGEIVVAKEMFEGKQLTDATIPPPPRKSRNSRRRPNRQQAAIPGAKEIGSREIYAAWLTDADNPRFAQVIANRLWKQAMGVGLIEPVDILEDSTVASNPELMDLLTSMMVELDFDMKQFLRAIYNTNVYQAEAYNQDIVDPAKFNFNGPKVRRLQAEQLWDSLLTLTVPNIDQRLDAAQIDPRYGNPYDVFEQLSQSDADELIEMARDLEARRRNAKNNAYKDDPDYQKMMAQRDSLMRKLRQARKKRDGEAARKLQVEIAKLGNEYRQLRNQRNYLRASEMQSPAPPGHFLREFGQSDREVIDNANTEPAVTQVLSMMNGYVEQRIARDPNSLLMQAALQTNSPEECTEIVFLSMLNRQPNSQELQVWNAEFGDAYARKDTQRIREAYGDLIWTLANSNEFIFQK